MAKFCTKCGRPLKEGEVCNCSVNYGYTQPQGNPNMYGQQSAPQSNPNMYRQQSAPQGNPNPYTQQGAPQGSPNPYTQQNGQNTYYQQGQSENMNMAGNPYNEYGRTKEAEWFNEKKNAVVSVTKNMFLEILPILKKPVTRVKELAAGNDAVVGIEFIAAKALLFMIMNVLFLMRIKDSLGIVGDYVEIPYFKILVLTLLLTAGIDFLEALFLKVFTGLFNGITNFNAMVNVVGARALYDTMIMLVAGILTLISVKFGLIVFMLATLITPYVEYHGYTASVQLDENKKVYAYYVVKVCVTVIVMLIAYLFLKGMINSAADSVGSLFEYMI